MTEKPTGPTFDASWDKETIKAAFHECVAQQALYAEWTDAIDKKTITIFTLATAIAGATINLLPKWGTLSARTSQGIALAGIAWLTAAAASWLAYRPRDIMVDPSPTALSDPRWLGKPIEKYMFFRIRDMGSSFEHNRDEINRKGHWLSVATIGTIAEVVFLSLALLAKLSGA
jgi:hypothetical protein